VQPSAQLVSLITRHARRSVSIRTGRIIHFQKRHCGVRCDTLLHDLQITATVNEKIWYGLCSPVLQNREVEQMSVLIYTFERAQPVRPEFDRPILADTVVGLSMASLGLPGIRRQVDVASDPLQVAISFPDQRALLRFNLRVERALAVRGVRIKKIRIAEESSPHEEQRAVA